MVNLLILFGGKSGEHEVSLSSARSVVAHLDPGKYHVVQVLITHAGNWVLASDAVTPVALLPSPTGGTLYQIRTTEQGQVLESLTKIDVVFPVLHGSFGEDGTLQGLLELADVAYVGAGVLGSAVGMDKAVFKDVMRAHNIPVVESILFRRSEILGNMEEVLARITAFHDFPIFVKPANLGSSVGVSRCTSQSDLVEGLLEAARFDRRILVERGVNAREIEVSVLGNDHPLASVPGEVLPSREFYSYESKYIDGTSGLIIPAHLDAEVTRQAQTLAIQAYQAFDCSGMARVDFLLDKEDGQLYLNEANTIPGFTEISMYSKLWEASGLDYSSLVERLIDLAFERKAERDHTEHQYTGGGR